MGHRPRRTRHRDVDGDHRHGAGLARARQRRRPHRPAPDRARMPDRHDRGNVSRHHRARRRANVGVPLHDRPRHRRDARGDQCRGGGMRQQPPAQPRGDADGNGLSARRRLRRRDCDQAARGRRLALGVHVRHVRHRRLHPAGAVADAGVRELPGRAPRRRTRSPASTPRCAGSDIARSDRCRPRRQRPARERARSPSSSPRSSRARRCC